MSAAEAGAIADWRYEPPYDFYNTRPADRAQTIRAFLDPAYAYQAVRLAGELVGFCCFGADARIPGGVYEGADLLDVGLGLRPDLTGRGLGPSFVRAVLAFGATAYAPSGFRLTVAAFNRRAIRAYEKVGFRVGRVFARPRAGEAQEWLQMVMARPEPEPDDGPDPT